MRTLHAPVAPISCLVLSAHVRIQLQFQKSANLEEYVRNARPTARSRRKAAEQRERDRGQAKFERLVALCVGANNCEDVWSSYRVEPRLDPTLARGRQTKQRSKRCPTKKNIGSFSGYACRGWNQADAIANAITNGYASIGVDADDANASVAVDRVF